MIRAENLTKRYGKHLALDNISFRIARGEVLGFLGPNGAGKSTAMNIITGYLSASDGDVWVNDLNVLEYPKEIKQCIGYLPEKPPLYPDMTVREYLTFVGEIKGVKKKVFAADYEKILDLVKIYDVRHRLIGNLSKGYQQRVGLAQALIGNPPLLILDEPTVGLDPKQIIEIRNLIKSLGNEHTIILSSHILPEVSAVCGRVLIINEGKIVASDSPKNLSRRLMGSGKTMVRLAGDEKTAVSVFEKLDGLSSCIVTGSNEEGTCDFLMESDQEHDIREKVFFACAENGLPILMMRPVDMSLEDIFLHLTTDEKLREVD
ncbi:ATP-binding cassette domain-containing protein [Marispirochaeta sp.]|uniref:ABC transporter ATP-binding protein n=1 Tax=Marispirochaeta sp. TaxID=2038653 RepID=UPI0029C97691|nr:ATP-binding cassette domain-containing protein [Marispirochaeta sp.]